MREPGLATLAWVALLPAALARAQVPAAPFEAQVGELPAAPDDRTDLAQALARALAKSPTAVNAAAELKRAAALTEQVRAAALPNASLNAQYTRLDGARSFAYPAALGGGTVVATPQDTFAGNLQVAVPLLAPQRWVQWAHALDNETVARWTEQDVRRQLAISVAHAYLTVLAQKRVVDGNQRASVSDKAHYDYTRQRHLGGLGTPLDELRARQQFASDASQLQSALLGLERTQEALGVLLGEDHPVDIAETLAPESVARLAFDVPGGLEEALGHLVERRVDLVECRERLRAARRVARDDYADYLPVLTGTFEPAYQAPPSAFQPRWSWELLLTASWAIYDGGLRYGLSRERAQLLVEADQSLKGQILQADSDVRAGSKAVQRNDAAFRAAQDAADSAHQAFQVADLQYKAGATTNIDVVDAERRAHDADTAAAVAEDSARQARLDLLAAMGRFP